MSPHLVLSSNISGIVLPSEHDPDPSLPFLFYISALHGRSPCSGNSPRFQRSFVAPVLIPSLPPPRVVFCPLLTKYLISFRTHELIFALQCHRDIRRQHHSSTSIHSVSTCLHHYLEFLCLCVHIANYVLQLSGQCIHPHSRLFRHFQHP